MKRIHVFGASGAGTSTLGATIARRTGVAFFDADDFFWERTDPPYQQPRDRAERERDLRKALPTTVEAWVLAGSICGWGDGLTDLFDLVVFVRTPTPVRLQRLREREQACFGARVGRGGDMHTQHLAFLDWAAQYDDGASDMRSRRQHEEWMARLSCPVRRVDGSRPIDSLCDEVLAAIT